MCKSRRSTIAHGLKQRRTGRFGILRIDDNLENLRSIEQLDAINVITHAITHIHFVKVPQSCSLQRMCLCFPATAKAKLTYDHNQIPALLTGQRLIANREN